MTKTTVLSPSLLQAEIQIDASAQVGYRSPVVTTGTERATEDMAGPFLVMPAPLAVPRLRSVTPTTGASGSSVTVTILGEHLSFEQGISSLVVKGTGVEVTDVSVVNATTLTASLEIAADASPSYRDVVVIAGDDTAVLRQGFLVTGGPTHRLSGDIRTPEGEGVVDVILEGLPGQPRTDHQGRYEVMIRDGWSGTVRPHKAGYLFEPESRTYAPVVAESPTQDYIGRPIEHYTFTVITDGSGTGTVLSDGIDCGTNCTETYPRGTIVHLKAIPDENSVFRGWFVDKESAEGILDAPMTEDVTVTAIFERK